MAVSADPFIGLGLISTTLFVLAHQFNKSSESYSGDTPDLNNLFNAAIAQLFHGFGMVTLIVIGWYISEVTVDGFSNFIEMYTAILTVIISVYALFMIVKAMVNIVTTAFTWIKERTGDMRG